MKKRNNTDYPGVYFIMGTSKTSGKTERIYYINYRLNGKRIEEKAGRANVDNMTPAKANRIRSLRIEGKELPNSERRKAAEQISLKKKAWTMDKLWDEFYYQKTEEGMKSIKDDLYRYNKYLAKSFGMLLPEELSIGEIDKLRIKLSRELKPATVKQILTLLQRIINLGIDKQIIPPINFKIKMPKFDNQRTEVLTSEQLIKLLNVLNNEPHNPASPIMKLALYTGMRKSEIFSLKWSDLDFESNFIYLRTPKSGKEEKIPMGELAKEVLQSQFKSQSPFVFPGRFGNKLNNISKSINKIKKKAQLPNDFRPLHGLRHTFASKLASSGKVDMYTLQKLLTHKSPQMTQRYAHLHDDTIKNAPISSVGRNAPCPCCSGKKYKHCHGKNK